jgi:ubiquinone/menaquinone biosynthesis C-methylase UbiE
MRQPVTFRNDTLDRQPARSLTDAIVAYYDETWLDYRLLWLNGRNLSVHFGYADAATRGHADALLNMNRVLADRIAIRPGERVLDAGCGVGGSSLWLAQERGAKVVGITPVASQVARARRFAAQRGLLADHRPPITPSTRRFPSSSRGRAGDHRPPTIDVSRNTQYATRNTQYSFRPGHTRFEQADYAATPFPDASFDVVWSLESLCHAPRKDAFYREAARLLRPGGRLVVAEYVRAARPLAPTDERLLHAWLGGWAIPDLDTYAEHLEHLTMAEFGDVRFNDVTIYTRPSLRRLYQLTYWTYPLAIMGRVVRIRSAIQHGNVIGSLRQYQALERGLWFYGIISATKPGVP